MSELKQENLDDFMKAVEPSVWPDILVALMAEGTEALIRCRHQEMSPEKCAEIGIFKCGPGMTFSLGRVKDLTAKGTPVMGQTPGSFKVAEAFVIPEELELKHWEEKLQATC